MVWESRGNRLCYDPVRGAQLGQRHRRAWNSTSAQNVGPACDTVAVRSMCQYIAVLSDCSLPSSRAGPLDVSVVTRPTNGKISRRGSTVQCGFVRPVSELSQRKCCLVFGKNSGVGNNLNALTRIKGNRLDATLEAVQRKETCRSQFVLLCCPLSGGNSLK